MSAQVEMPRYRSHKVVHALRLAWVRIENTPPPAERDVLVAQPADAGYAKLIFEMDSEFAKRCRAIQMGDAGYYVVYPDGFVSWSPTKAFEDGYSEVGSHEMRSG